MPSRKKFAFSSALAMSGTFTRSRSEIFLHRTRSGRARPDPKRRHPAPIPPIDEQPPKSVKDLRLKRVFSDHSVMIDIGVRVDEKISGSDDFDVSKGSSVDSVEYLKETTPTALDTATESDGGVRISDEMDLRNSPEIKRTPFPSSRLKVIGNPTSFSYRRLLPYLKEFANDGSSGIEIVHSHNCSANVEKPMKERTLQSNPSSVQQNHDVHSGDPPTMNSAGNRLAHSSIYSHETVWDMHMKVESPSQSKLLRSEVTSKVEFNNNMDELNKEQEGVKTDSDGSRAGILQVSENPSQEEFHSTPPDIELPANSDGVEFGRVRTSSETVLTNNRSKNSLGLVSCSRSKLYRNPSSFSYRRLLPYLMDLAKNGSGALEVIRSQTNTTKVENSIEERPMVTSIPSPERQQHSVPIVGISHEHSSGSEHQDLVVNQVSGSLSLDFQGDINNPVAAELSNSGALEVIHSQTNTTKVENSIEEMPMVTSIPSPERQQHSVHIVAISPEHSSGSEHQDLEVNQVSGSLSLDFQGGSNNPVAAELSNSCNESKLQVLEASKIPTERSEFELFKTPFYAPMISQDLSFEELAGNVMQLSYPPMETDRMYKEKLHQSEAIGRGVNRSLAPRKGILKKQSKVCKGICLCLDCATFRVHAERSYEFSRRQMLDADEVIARLMKELSCLRNLTEKSVLMVDGAESDSVLQVNQEEVKGVCQRASRVEEHAKIRVKQMFGELNAHCKIPGPRVAFSDYVDGKNIP